MDPIILALPGDCFYVLIARLARCMQPLLTEFSIKHVAIIMDGNGRWAQKRKMPRLMGHTEGAKNLAKIVETAHKFKIPFLTVFAFSTENRSRPEQEVSGLINLINKFLAQYLKKLIDHNVCLRIIGDYTALPGLDKPQFEEALRATKNFKDLTLTVALNYGSRAEIVRACKTFSEEVKSGKRDPGSLDWEALQSYLYTAEMPDPDLIIRTAGESRLSNFLLLQSAYAEIFISPHYWPDFSPTAFIEALKYYQDCERRFGGISTN